MKKEMGVHAFELTLAGFDGGTDATDHLIIAVGTSLSHGELSGHLRESGLYPGKIKTIAALPDAYLRDFEVPSQMEALIERVDNVVAAEPATAANRLIEADRRVTLSQSLEPRFRIEHCPNSTGLNWFLDHWIEDDVGAGWKNITSCRTKIEAETARDGMTAAALAGVNGNPLVIPVASDAGAFRQDAERLYVISGRVPGDDDDSVQVLVACSVEEATARFRENMTADLDEDGRAALISRHDSDCFVVSTTLIGEYIGATRLHIADEFKLDDLQRVDAEPAAQFMQELLASVETLSDVVETYGARTLADLMYLQNAVVNGSYIDHHPDESAVVDVLKTLPSCERWLAFVKVVPGEEHSPNPSPGK